MIYKKALICKTKNLFDITKVTNSSNIQSDDKDIICSSYGTSIGVLKDLCPSLKVGDTVTLSLTVKSTTSIPPKFVSIQGLILYIDTGNVTFTVTEDGLNSRFYLYNTTYENKNVPTTTVFTDIMIELGDTATSYVPYGYLQSYKKAIKVSDICQLANSKLFTPMNNGAFAIAGVSITKNIEAGTITFNGTSTNNFWYHVHDFDSELKYTNLIKGYKYYISGLPVNDLGVVFQLTSLFNLQGEQIFTAPRTSDGTGAFNIYVPKGVTLTDFVVTPQLFNLTEMYGQGNEPKTIAEFRQKFPNDLYPYRPYCFVDSYKKYLKIKENNNA